MRISDWSSDVCSSDLILAIVDRPHDRLTGRLVEEHLLGTEVRRWRVQAIDEVAREQLLTHIIAIGVGVDEDVGERCRRVADIARFREQRSEEHTSELQSLMRISYAVFCLKKKQKQTKSQS